MYGSLVLFYLCLQRVSGLSIIHMVTHAGNVNVLRMNGFTLSRSCKPLIDCLKEQKPPQGYTTLALQPFSGPTDRAALPQHLHRLALLTPLPLNFIQPPSAAFLSVCCPSFLHFFVLHTASFCVQKAALFPALIHHFFHHPMHSSFPL
jgi:hypothetical protein